MPDLHPCAPRTVTFTWKEPGSVGLACGRTMMGTDVRCVSGVLLSTQGCRALRATA